MEVVALARSSGDRQSTVAVASPTQNLKLVHVPNYGTMVLENDSPKLPLLVPMHIGFFQHGAQNHATSRALVFGPGERRTIEDCFCIQAAQGGLLQESEQRFLMLPIGLRAAALSKRHTNGYSRLWNDIDGYTRHFGVSRGGHLERLLRPNFRKLLPFRHAFEATDGQVGGAYFVAGQLAGLEVTPSVEFYSELSPILSIYCYGPSALLAERDGKRSPNVPVDLTGLIDLTDLTERLTLSRQTQLNDRVNAIRRVLDSEWTTKSDEHRSGFRVSTISTDGWIGQTVHWSDKPVYVSIFRDTAPTVRPNSSAV